jgi:hypothetical protein
MLSYDKLKDKPRAFLAATGGTLTECARFFPAVQTAYAPQYPSELTYAGQTRPRSAGGGAHGTLATFADTLLCMLVDQQTNPLQVMHGRQFERSQSPAHYWRHRRLPVLRHAWRELGQAPEREAQRVETSALAWAGAPNLAVEGTDRRRQRPRDAAKQQEHYSGKNKTHTDKNSHLVNAQTNKVVYLGPTRPGPTHDKKAVDDAEIPSRANTPVDKETGCQGYEPARVWTPQPPKSPTAKR